MALTHNARPLVRRGLWLAVLSALLWGAVAPVNVPGAYAHTPQCADGADNDGDLKTDYGSDPLLNPLPDPDCTSPTDDSESSSSPPPPPPAAEEGKIAFSRNSNIYTMNPDGSGATNLTNYEYSPLGPNSTASEPAFSPDGKKIVFVGNSDNIWVMNSDGSDKRNLTNLPKPNQYRDPEFSPDGQRIAFSSTGDIWTINVDGPGNLTNVTNTPEFETAPDFAPDGRIFFESGSPVDIYVMNGDGSGVARLTTTLRNYDPAVSPDGTKVAFRSQRDHINGQTEIYVMNADGSGQTRLTYDAAANRLPSFSPDGRKITYTDTSSVYVITVNGLAATKIADNANWPDWGPGPDGISAQCSDGADNDGDGQVDHPADLGCESTADNSESPDPGQTFQCSDGADNDGDGRIDHPADLGCDATADNSESPDPGQTAQCSDRADNDGDGLADYPADVGCESEFDDTEAPNLVSPESSKRRYGASVLGEPGGTGWRGVAAGDLDGDGVGDFFVQGFAERRGVILVHAFSGKDRSLIYTIEVPWISHTGRLDYSVDYVYSMLGDVNDDGVPDLAIGAGAPEALYVHSGKDGKLLNTITRLADPDREASFPGRVGAAGDVDGDGRSEIIVGAATATVCADELQKSECRSKQGRVYIYEASGELYRTLDLPVEDRAPASCNDTRRCGSFGKAVQGPGDINGDGVVDHLVGAPFAGDGSRGRMYLFSGSTGELLRKIDPPEWDGRAGYFGFQDVTPLSPGDVNGDGTPDLYGANFTLASGERSIEGKAWVFDGKSCVDPNEAACKVLYTLADPSPQTGGAFGWSMDRTDYDRDGTPDLFVGQAPHDMLYQGPGGSYIFSGKDGSLLKALELPPGAVGSKTASLGYFVAAPGDLNDDGLPDYVAGAPLGLDEGGSRLGRTYVYLSQPPLQVFRPAQGVWYAQEAIPEAVAWGAQGDIPVLADYDGDGSSERAVFRPSNGTWYVLGGAAVHWGTDGDIPVPADYDGDGRAEFAVFRPSNGTWYVLGGATVHWGTDGDIPVPADYDGDGRAEFAVFRPSNGTWYVLGGATVRWGTRGDIAVTGDYDGNGTADFGVFRPSNGTWYVRGAAPEAVTYGTSGDIPVPTDYDGNGTADLGVFRPSNGTWHVRGAAPEAVAYGTRGDIPVSATPAVMEAMASGEHPPG